MIIDHLDDDDDVDDNNDDHHLDDDKSNGDEDIKIEDRCPFNYHYLNPPNTMILMMMLTMRMIIVLVMWTSRWQTGHNSS